MDADELSDKEEWAGIKPIGRVIRERITEKNQAKKSYTIFQVTA